MRLFLALWPDSETRERVVAQTRAIVRAGEGRAVPPENLHITLAFLHSVAVEKLPCIGEAANRAGVETAVFQLQLSRVGHWYRSRILWLAPGQGGLQQPAGLADALWRELVPCGFTAERRRYMPHVTLARKVVHPPDQSEVPAIRWTAKDFVLVESVTGSGGSNYRILERFILAGPA